MTPTKLKFTSNFIQERDKALTELAKKKDREIVDKNVKLAEKDAEIVLLKQQIYLCYSFKVSDLQYELYI